MNETLSAPALASVIVLKIQDFTRRPVLEQTRLKAQLETLVGSAIQSLPAADRIVLDAPGGIAVVVLGGPADALGLAERSQAGAADLPLCIGINYGPVKHASDVHRGSGLVGDGLSAAATLANVATPGRILASRSFQEAVAAGAPERAEVLSPAGVYTDTSVRTHELYTLDRQTGLRRRRRLILIGAVTVAAVLGLGVAARSVRFAMRSQRPAIIEFEIAPRGDIVIDGVVKGRSPPLARLEVSPGHHTIEVRNSPYPPLKLEVNLRPEEQITIRHSFAKPKKERGFFDGLRRQLGF